MNDNAGAMPHSSVRGREVIAEAAAFLRAAKFTLYRGSHAHGEHVAVHIGVTPDEHAETMTVSITCYAFRHRLVDWDGMPLFVYAADSRPESTRYVVFLNKRGQAFLHHVDAGEYRIATSDMWGVGIAERQESRGPRTYRSNDGRVELTFGVDRNRQPDLRASSGDRSLDNTRILYAFVEEVGGTVNSRGSMVMRQVRRAAGASFGPAVSPILAHNVIARAKDLEHFDPATRQRLIFCVVPETDTQEGVMAMSEAQRYLFELQQSVCMSLFIKEFERHRKVPAGRQLIVAMETALKHLDSLPSHQQPSNREEWLVDTIASMLAAPQSPECNPYEDPSFISILSKLLGLLKRAAAVTSFPLPEDPCIGSLPLGQPNAEVLLVPSGEGGEYVIVIQTGLFDFLHLLTKVIVQLLPVKSRELLSEIAVDQDYVQKDKHGLQRFRELLDAYVLHGNCYLAPSYRAEEPLLTDALLTASELFVLCHEYGHMYHAHLQGGAMSMRLLGKYDVDTFRRGAEQEFHADSAGLQLMLAALKDIAPLELRYCGAEVFLSGVDLLNRAICMLLTGKDGVIVHGPHPPVPYRRKFLREFFLGFLKRDGCEAHAVAPVELGKAIERLIEQLWVSVREDYLALHKQGVRPADIWLPPQRPKVFAVKLGGEDVRMIKGAVRFEGRRIDLIVEYEILEHLEHLGLRSKRASGQPFRNASEGGDKDFIDPSCFTNLVEDAIHDHGVEKFQGLEELKTLTFLSAQWFITENKQARLAGYDKKSGLFCITKKVFKEILPAIPQEKYRRVLLELYIGRALKQALGRTWQQLDQEDNPFIVKMLGPQKTNELAQLLNRAAKDK